MGLHTRGLLQHSNHACSHHTPNAIAVCREILWQQGAEPLRIPANANVTIHCYGAAISTFHAQGPVTMGHDSTLTFSECNLTTISSTVSGLWAEHNSPFSTFEGDHTATVILDNCVARFTHSVRFSHASHNRAIQPSNSCVH